MHAMADTTDSAIVTERGERIQRRLEALRISDREFHAHSGIDRKTLRRAVSGDASVRPNTYRTIEDWLERLERKAQTFEGIPDVPSESEERFVELQMEGVFGVAKVVVRGPVDDPDAVARAASALMRELRAEQGRQQPKTGSGDEGDAK